MKFEAPQFDEQLNPNIPHEHPLKEWWRMCAWLVGLAVVVWLALGAMTWVLPRWISIEQERTWLGDLAAPWVHEARRDAKLQALADKLAQHMALPQGSVRVYIGQNEMVNAFATFGGNVVLMQGLLNELPSEEAVAAVLAHEMGHIKHRDPLRSMSRSMVLGVLSAAIFGSDSSLQQISQLETLRYSRDLEEAADAAALHALAAHYRHVGGMVQTLQILNKVDKTHPHLAWVNTHPHPQQRLTAIQDLAQQHQYTLQPPVLPNQWRAALPN